MDPVSAFGLACGVIQVVDFSAEVVKKCRELYKDGTLSQNKEAEEMALHLTQLRTSLNLPKHQDQDQGELLKLGEKCSATAHDLVTELQKLKVSGPHRKRQVFGKTMRTIWKKTAIDGIQKRLDDYRNMLDHRVLIDLRKRFDLLSIQQNEGFQNLDLKVRTIITNLAQGPKTFEELKVLVRNEAQSVKEHVTNEFQQHQRDLAHKEYCQRFLDSLWFPEIYRRQEIIHEAHEKTFQWIYELDETGKKIRRWDNFVHWLENGKSTYWIYGKAGSGKSTLMNYIYQDDRTAASLKVWSGSKEIFTPGFFFWNAGEALEKSSDGLLRSLIYQLLKRFPSLTPSSQIVSSSESTQNDPWSHEPIAAWTERRLHATFETVLRQAQETCRICVFIDGLDEFSGDQDVLMKLIGKVQTADVKVCLSSRPYRSYSEAFGLSAKLQLQDLTESDIRRYVSDKLHPLVKTGSAEYIYHLFDTVVYKAEGVFLWVELVVKDLIKGLENDDTLEQLQDRLEFMPSDIEDLYTHMLSKIDRVYRAKAAKLFQMTLSGLTESLFTLALALFRRSDKISDIGLSDTIAYSEEARKKIPTICAGLLEVHWLEDPLNIKYIDRKRLKGGLFQNADPSLALTIQYAKSSELAEVEFLQNGTSVGWIHRTARDYLEQGKQGKQFLHANLPPNFDPYVSHVNALLIEATQLGFAAIGRDEGDYDGPYDYHKQDSYASRNVHDIMTYLSLAERQAHTAQVSLGDDIDCTLAAIYSRHGLPSPKILREIMENISVAERQNGTAQVSICAAYEEILAKMNRQSSPKAHWSVPWGICSDFCVSSGEIAGLSSTSSSNSANIEPRHRENPSLMATRPVDFVGVAAFWGLSRYFEQKLDCESKAVDQDTADYLLCCSVWGFRNATIIWGDHSNRILRLCTFIVEVLRLGGNCNIYVKDFLNTLWGDFLTQITWILDDVQEQRRSDIPRGFAIATKAFLEHGADVHVKTYREVYVRLRGLGFLEGQVALESKKFELFTCSEENTALYAIQEHFGDIPEFETLRKYVLDKGGSSSSRWTHIALNGSRPYKISEQQNHDFKAAFRAYGANSDGDGDSKQRRQKCALQIARLYKEICGETRDVVDILGASYKDDSLDFEMEEGSHVQALLVFRRAESRRLFLTHPIQI